MENTKTSNAEAGVLSESTGDGRGKPLQIKMQKDIDKESEVQRLLAAERARLEAEYGLKADRIDHFKRPLERTFTKDQRADTTILFGGLTWKHEKLIQGVLRGLGYNASEIPTPNKRAF